MGERIVERLIRERDAGYSNGIYAATQVWFAWNSNHMEGSTLTPEQTAQIFATDTFALDGTERVRVDNAFKRDITARAKERLASLQDAYDDMFWGERAPSPKSDTQQGATDATNDLGRAMGL